MVRLAWLGILLTIAAPGVRAGEVAEGYELIQITEDADFDDGPRMNNCGQVVFSKRILPTDGQFSTEEIFLWENGVTTRLTHDNVRDAFPDINDHGVIVWSRAVDPGGHFAIARLEPGGEIEILTDTPLSDYSPRINNRGQIAWNTWLNDAQLVSEVFLYDSGRIWQITNDGLASQDVCNSENMLLGWMAYNFLTAPWTSYIRSFFDGRMEEHPSCGSQAQGVDINMEKTLTWSTQEGVVFKRFGKCIVRTEGLLPRINCMGSIVYTRWKGFGNLVESKRISPGGKLLPLCDLPDNVSARGMSADGSVVAVRDKTDGVRLLQRDIVVLRWMGSAGDLDQDGDVDLFDFSLAQRFLDPGIPPFTPCPIGDFSRDGVVNLEDWIPFIESTTGPTSENSE